MKVTRLEIPEVVLLEPKVFGDERGFFMESFNKNKFEEAVGYSVDFVQDNHSRSRKGVLRGLHYQLPPHAQGKLVRVTSGEVFDVAVDVRKNSATFGRWVGAYLSEENKHQLWIPEGFAHGFVVISEMADFLYKTTGFYCPESEGSIIWNDGDIGVDWPEVGVEFIISEKDRSAKAIHDVPVFE